MKGTKELLILALPIMAAGCNGSSNPLGSQPPSAGVDPEGIYQGQAGNGDTIFGIVAADGTADFLQFSGSLTSLSTSTPFVVLASDAIVPDENGNYSVSYDGYSGNGYTLPSNDINETGTFSGLAIAASSLSGNYTVTGSIPSSIVVHPQTTSTINYNMTYQSSLYETSANSTIVAGTYSVSLVVGTTVVSGGVFTIEAGASSAQAGFANGTDGGTSCLYSGNITIPDTSRNAYEISIQSSGCPEAFDNLAGVGSLLPVNSTTTMLAILSDQGTGQGVLLILTKTS